ncbi:hypothetical protein GOP47_0010965 [Adiantum capillus-veneris]|nr:hypothetical protein GOP47_0010965 [Adiantum capillus-veneris]
MQVGQRLVAQGVRVTLATVDHLYAKIVRSSQQQLSSSGTHTAHNHFQLLGIKDGLPPDFDRDTWTEFLQNSIDYGLLESALELVESLASQGHPITCIVSDFFLRWASSLAEQAAVPEFILWPQCASVFSIYLHVDAIIASGYDPFEANVPATASRETPMTLITCVPGLPMGIHPGDLPLEYRFFGKAGVDWIRGVLSDRFKCMGKAMGVIGNSFEALEPEVLGALTLEFQKGIPHPNYGNCWPKSIRLVGPLLPMTEGKVGGVGGDAVSGASSFWAEEVDECREWLDLQPSASVILVAFGSISTMNVEQVQELALGLAGSGERCLWVIRENAIKGGSEAESSVQLEEVLPKGFLEKRKQGVCKVVRWAPQAMVLSHPAVGGFFSHCGWNSTLESLCSGVPLLGWPWFMDQVTNCWLASQVWKVGLTLERDQNNQASRAQVERGVRQLMSGALASSLRARARQLSDLAHQALLLNHNFLSFVDDIRNLPLV